jgi:hypothetical protein
MKHRKHRKQTKRKMKKIQKKQKTENPTKKRQEIRWALSTRERGQPIIWQPGLIFLIKKFNEELGAGRYIYKLKGLMLVPINWDTLRPRKQKMEARSNDTTKKTKKGKSRKKGNGI